MRLTEGDADMIVHRKPVEAYGADGQLLGQWPSII